MRSLGWAAPEGAMGWLSSALGRCENARIGRQLFSFQRVLDAADCVLNLACGLVGLSLGFELGIASKFASDFPHLTLACWDDPFMRSLSIS